MIRLVCGLVLLRKDSKQSHLQSLCKFSFHFLFFSFECEFMAWIYGLNEWLEFVD